MGGVVWGIHRWWMGLPSGWWQLGSLGKCKGLLRGKLEMEIIIVIRNVAAAAAVAVVA